MTQLFAVICRGTKEDVEWLSNFNLIGQNANFHAGFYSAAKDASDHITSYINGYLIDGLSLSDCKVWVTGHSRGAAVANLLGGVFLNKMGFKEDHIFAYTFACPSVTLERNTTRNYIFNYNLGGDLVPRVPMWQYARYGVTHDEPNPDKPKYAKGKNLIDNATMNEFCLLLELSTDPEELMEYVNSEFKQSLGNTTVNYAFIVKALLINPAINQKLNTGFKMHAYGTIVEIVKDIYDTHYQGTYLNWINSL